MPPTFFVSYARADARYPQYRDELRKFIADLQAAVAVKLTVPFDGVAFFDESSIETGEVWSDVLADALTTCSVGVALYTPNYFASTWCGKEFEVFKRRRPLQRAASGIVPVLWMKCTAPPEVAEFQYKSDAFPSQYAEVGMHALKRLDVYRDQYTLSVDAVADRIVAVSKGASALEPLKAALNLDAIPSAWKPSTKVAPHSHKEGSVSKTNFVFVSREGWDWEPYPAGKIGALAQNISGDLQLRFVEIECDDKLKDKLREANENRVPTVLFGDPTTLAKNPAYAQPMRDYDSQYLLNCAAIVPWDEASKQTGDADERWVHLKTVCPQKTEAPPPFHEWRSIFSPQDLEQKTRTTIEQIRSRLMRRAMSVTGDGLAGGVRKAEDATLSENAASIGIATDLIGRLDGPRQ